jgi:hypothetical protein
LLGDDLIQLAPYNTYYERLEAHLHAARIRTAPNCWDTPLNLAASVTSVAPAASLSATLAAAPPAAAAKLIVSLLPPERFLPFMVSTNRATCSDLESAQRARAMGAATTA